MVNINKWNIAMAMQTNILHSCNVYIRFIQHHQPDNGVEWRFNLFWVSQFKGCEKYHPTSWHPKKIGLWIYTIISLTTFGGTKINVTSIKYNSLHCSYIVSFLTLCHFLQSYVSIKSLQGFWDFHNQVSCSIFLQPQHNSQIFNCMWHFKFSLDCDKSRISNSHSLRINLSLLLFLTEEFVRLRIHPHTRQWNSFT